MTVRETMRGTRVLVVGGMAPDLERFTADHWARTLGLTVPVVAAGDMAARTTGALRFEAAADGASEPFFFFRIAPDGSGILQTSHPYWFFFFVSTILRNADRLTAEACAEGIRRTPPFQWVRNLSDLLVGSQRNARGFSPEDYIAQLARQGFTHVTVNGLGVPRPFESGPPGDMYHWFYDYSPDLDQFVASPLIAGYYPPDYLSANLAALQRNAALVRRFGLVPGLHINSPRSMPEEFWARNGHLRGARIDHPRETFRPRYTLAMSHPAVQEHYRALVRAILREVPDLGFIHLWTNDSGSGFEFVTSLYAGRNGGPYLLREWKGHDEIARAAARNVLTYFHLLRDEARQVRSSFRVICDLASFYAERQYILPGMGDGLDAGAFGSFEEQGVAIVRKELDAAGIWIHEKVDLAHLHLLGLPFPALVHERLAGLARDGVRAILGAVSPRCMAPHDVNGDIVQAFLADPAEPFPSVLDRVAAAMAGDAHASTLARLWMLADTAVRAYPADTPLGTFAFPWFRLWVRPFVPDIDAIPEEERAYYERFLLATFNNPARIDLNADMLWVYLTVEQAEERRDRIDRQVLPPLDEALRELAGLTGADAPTVFADLRDRLAIAHAFFTTMRTMLAWTAAVHGYRRAEDPAEKARRRADCASMVTVEIANARRLLDLWRGSGRHLFPVAGAGETLHIHGDNFGELLERKILLMERHRDDEPRVDAGYMWRGRTD